jgi:serine/threonine-protein kinase
VGDTVDDKTDAAETAQLRPAGEAPTALAETEALATIASRLGVVDHTHYEVVAPLGQGGMGRVYIAVDKRLGRRLAIKELLRSGEHAEARFAREAVITARLQHPSIVPVHEAGRWPSGKPFYAMKLLAGRPLSRLLVEKTTLDERLTLLPQLAAVADAVAYAHSRRVVHRDLKPDNVVVGDFGETVIIDWGLAKIVDITDEESDAQADGEATWPDARDSQTRVGARMGTPGYASPEQSAGLPVDARTDVYALGAMLYRTLTGFAPRAAAGLGASLPPGEPLPLPLPPSFPPGLPPALVALCKRALENDPALRPASAQVFRQELEAAMGHRAAELLVDEAERRLSRLADALTQRIDGKPVDRHLLYGLFGACRFGFEQALARFPDDNAARSGLERAISALVRYELESGDPKAARALLAGLQPVPAALESAVAEAERTAAAAEAERAQLVARGRDHDPRVGEKTRFLLTLLVGGIWTATPLVSTLLEPISYAMYAAVTLGFLGFIGVVWLLAKAEIRKSAINRTLVGVGAVLHLSQLALYTGYALVGDPSWRCDIQHLLLWSVIASTTALALDKRLLIPSVMLAGAYLGASRWPAARHYLESAGTFSLTLTGLYIWRPKK